MIERLVPPVVRTAEVFGEREAGPSAVASGLADRLLSAAGGGSGLLGHGAAGEPLWPAGFRGSITHCEGYVAVVAAAEGAVPCLGVDAEPAAALPEGVLAEIALPGELRRLGRAARVQPAVAWDRLLFCAKEAVYKAWYPAEHTWLDFSDIEVWLGPRRVRMLVRAPTGGRVAYRGRWLCAHGLLVVAVTGRRVHGSPGLPSRLRTPGRCPAG